MTSVSAGHIVLTPTKPVGSEQQQRGSNPGSPQEEMRALPTEQPRPQEEEEEEEEEEQEQEQEEQEQEQEEEEEEQEEEQEVK